MPLAIDCPACREPLEVEDEYRAWKVRCPSCGHEFRPVEEDESAAGAPLARRRPRRRRREYDPAAAREAVATPAMLLGLAGWAGGLLTLFGAGLFICLGLAAANQPPAQGKDPPEMFIVLGACFGVFGLPYFGLIVHGARHLRRLSSYGWATTAAVLATGSIVLFGLCGFLLVGPGIWSLIVINQPNVRDAFETNQKRDDYGDDED